VLVDANVLLYAVNDSMPRTGATAVCRGRPDGAYRFGGPNSRVSRSSPWRCLADVTRPNWAATRPRCIVNNLQRTMPVRGAEVSKRKGHQDDAATI
jgi:hypothetical protein